MSDGDKNAYFCPECEGYIVTIDVDEGVTPMFLACRVKGDPRDPENDCHGAAQSMMYPAEPWPAFDPAGRPIPDIPKWEWYRPSLANARRQGPDVLEHVSKGGLLLRKVGEAT